MAKVIIPSFVSTLKTTRELVSRSKDVPEVGLFQCDGEKEQLDVFTCPGAIEMLQQHFNVMKHSAGCSFLWQSNDVGHCHSSLHKFVNSQTFQHLLSVNDVAEIELVQKNLKAQGKKCIGTETVNKLLRA
jgi:hypothetical protein